MKKMMYTGFVILISCMILTSWTKDKQQPAPQNRTQSTANSNVEQPTEENVIYITAEGYDQPDFWVGKTIPVTWINVDNAVHTVTDDSGEFDSGPMKPGDSFTISFPHAGVWSYHDEFSKATGLVNVIGRDE